MGLWESGLVLGNMIVLPFGQSFLRGLMGSKIRLFLQSLDGFFGGVPFGHHGP